MSRRLAAAGPGERFDQGMDVLRAGGLFGAEAQGRPGHNASRPRTGDVILRLLALPESIGLASSNLSGYSHCGVIRELPEGLFAEDCYPALNGHAGGARRLPLAAWTTREGPADVLHWLILRHPAIDPDLAAAVLDALVASKPRFALVLDREERLGQGLGAAANCSAFVRAFLEGSGVDCSPALAARDITTTVLTRFFSLARQGFYAAIPGGAGGDFYALAEAHGLTALAAYPAATLPAGFCELLPRFSPILYGQNQAVPPAERRLLLLAYAGIAPTLRAALACHGLSPEAARAWLKRGNGRGLSTLLGALPPGRPVDGTRLAIDRLLALADTPDPYLTIPLATHFGLRQPGPAAGALLAGLLRLMPPLAALARRLGVKPFHLFDAAPRP